MPNVARFARALFALHQEDLLKHPACKEPVTLFIRKATEEQHWHNKAHYRSRAAAAVIAAATIRSEAAYQKFCVRNLRHEHMVPNAVIYKLILQQGDITIERLQQLLSTLGRRATITRAQDALLPQASMPAEFYTSGDPMYMNPLARYEAAGIAGDLDELTATSWYVHDRR